MIYVAAEISGLIPRERKARSDFTAASSSFLLASSSYRHSGGQARRHQPVPRTGGALKLLLEAFCLFWRMWQ